MKVENNRYKLKNITGVSILTILIINIWKKIDNMYYIIHNVIHEIYNHSHK